MPIIGELASFQTKPAIKKALSVSPRVVGINNRDLKTFSVDLETTLRLLAAIPDDVTVVTESGISDNSDIVKMMASGVFGFLIGEALMKEKDPGAAFFGMKNRITNSKLPSARTENLLLLLAITV